MNTRTKVRRYGWLLALAAACAEPVAPPEEAQPEPVVARAGVRYVATAMIASHSPLVVHTEVRLTNTTAADVEIRVASHCAVLLRVYDNARFSGRAAWDGTTDARTCTTLVRPIRIGPGETRVFAADARPDLARGRYWFVAVLRQADRDVHLAAGQADVDAR